MAEGVLGEKARIVNLKNPSEFNVVTVELGWWDRSNQLYRLSVEPHAHGLYRDPICFVQLVNDLARQVYQRLLGHCCRFRWLSCVFYRRWRFGYSRNCYGALPDSPRIGTDRSGMTLAAQNGTSWLACP